MSKQPQPNKNGLFPFKFTKPCTLSTAYNKGEIAGFSEDVCENLKAQKFGDYYTGGDAEKPAKKASK